MTTRPYSDCLAQALALCGVPDANTVEVARVKTFINRRARQAYAESELWPRWLVVGEERIVSEDGLLPYEQDGFQDIGTIQRLHEAQPYVSDPAGEYVDWTAQSDGIQINSFSGPALASVAVSGAISPDATGDYLYQGTDFAGTELDKPWYLLGKSGETPGGYIVWNDPYWQFIYVTAEGVSSLWRSDEDVATPDLVTSWDAVVSASGEPTVTAVDLYTAFITYKAAFSTTYGTGESEEDEVPEEWFEWMASGAAADFLRSDKEHEAALIMEGMARTDLDNQLDKISRQNGNKVQTRILSHGNMQAR